MSKTFLTDINLSQNELQNAVIQNLAVEPSSPKLGQIIFNTTLNQQGYFDGTIWIYSTAANPNMVTKTVNATTAGVLQVSGGADKTLADFTSAGGILKTSPTGATSIATANTDYLAPSIIDIDGTLTANSDTIIASQKATKTYVDNTIAVAITGIYNDRGNFDASTGTFPTTGGSGVGGAIKKGDIFTISVAGTLGGVVYQVGDTVRALVDAPAQTSTNWAGGQSNIDYATETTQGLVILATQAETEAKTNNVKVVTPADLVSFPTKKTFTVGDGTATSYVLTHNFGSMYISVQLQDTVSGEIVETDITNSTTNTTTISFAVAPTTGQYTAVLIG